VKLLRWHEFKKSTGVLVRSLLTSFPPMRMRIITSIDSSVFLLTGEQQVAKKWPGGTL
jgi:hypothetical protein